MRTHTPAKFVRVKLKIPRFKRKDFKGPKPAGKKVGGEAKIKKLHLLHKKNGSDKIG